ncbi:MAG TPA: ABC transporter ATP-binding protein [Gaiellales bacterium]|jgi:ABC-type lipoprotein export system ATPase subunit
MHTEERLAQTPATDAVPVYELAGVGRAYGGGNGGVTALADVDLVIRPGEFVAVAGASGSGKTTLLQLLGALDRPTSGTIHCLGRDISRMGPGELSRLRRETIGFIFQQFNLIPTLTAIQNVEAAIATRRSGERHRRAHDLLAMVGLSHRVDHLPSRMSGGEQQRVAIARALANDPGALLADEPTGNLDSQTGQEILALLRGLSTEHGQTVVLVTHDTHVAETAPRTVRLSDGRVVSDTANAAAISDPA